MKRINKRREPNYMKVYMFGKNYDWPNEEKVYWPRKWEEKDKILYWKLYSIHLDKNN